MPASELSQLTVDDDATVVQGPLQTGTGRTPDEPEVAPPRSLGRYMIIAELGVGGMGRVFRAYDPELDREVAVKLLRRVTADARSRLRREAQAMAQLSHPNVLPIYDVSDGDVADGGRHVFIAMELVRGQSLREWLDAGAHGWRQVLEVFIAAGRGLAAAHDAGIVHRDFKPGNVLLGEDGRVRVMDFGLARGTADAADGSVAPRSSSSWSHGSDESAVAADGLPAPALRSTDSHDLLSSLAADLTQHGTVVGTPAYMAPEQHLGHAADPRCDQYGFCVALWEALYGRRPFEAEGLPEWYRAKTTATPAVDPARGVPPWLRAVVQRGLRPQPEDRFPSMLALLHALEQGTRRRRTWRMAALGVGGLLLVGGIGVSLHAEPRLCSGAEDKLAGIWDDATASAVERALLASGVGYAPDTWARLQPRLHDYAAQWQAAFVDACEATHVLREQPEALMDARMRCLEDRRRSLRALVRTLELADAEVVQRAVSAVGALPPLEPCADPAYVQAQALPPTDPAQAAEVEAIEEELARLKALVDAGQAKAVEHDAVALVERTEALGHAALAARALLLRGGVEDDLGRYEASGEHLERAYFVAQREGLDALQARAAAQLVHVRGSQLDRFDEGERWSRFAEAALERAHDPTLETSYLTNAGMLSLDRSDHAQALAQLERALALCEAQRGPDHPEMAPILNNLALAHDAMGHLEEARAIHERALALRERVLGSTHPEVASSLLNLANVNQALADNAQARDRLLRALTIFEGAYGRRHPMVAASLINLGNVYDNLGQPERALASFQEALPLVEESFGPLHSNMIGTVVNIGSVYRTLGEPDRALEHYERALGLLEKTQGHDFLHAIVLTNLTAVVLDRGDVERAEAHAVQGLALAERATGLRHPLAAALQTNLAQVRTRQGRHDEAASLHRTALDVRRELLGPHHPETVTSLAELGEALLEAGQPAEAITALEEAVANLGREGLLPNPDDQAAALHELRFSLARAHWQSDVDRPAARAMAQAARDALRELPGDRAQAIAEVEAWLAEHGEPRPRGR